MNYLRILEKIEANAAHQSTKNLQNYGDSSLIVGNLSKTFTVSHQIEIIKEETRDESK